MSGWSTTVALVVALVVVLAACHVPLGDYMARVYTSERHLRVESAIYRLSGINPEADQRWPVYARSVLVFSATSVVLLYAILRLQMLLPWSAGRNNMPPLLSLNTATSFVTNTNWQNYSGETLGYFAQMAGLAVQNFLSAAVGLAVAIAVIRGFTRTNTDRLGNFWVDLVRGTGRILLPLAVVATIVMLVSGVIQNLDSETVVTTLDGGTQTLPGGPFASQEAIKELGTNGGGPLNANSAHPFEGPSPAISLFQVFLLLVIPFSLPRTFGKLVGDARQGVAIVATMATLWLASTLAIVAFELAHTGAALQSAGAAMEGKEVRFGVPLSGLFASSTTTTSTGAVNSMHDSYTAGGGGVAIFNMALGEVAPGGVGSGLYGMVVLAIVAVFIAGLMVGRTPEYLGKKMNTSVMKFAALFILVTPILALSFTAIAIGTPWGRDSILNPGPHGLSEVLYGFTSPANNNGSAFAGLAANTPFYNLSQAFVMVIGRFLPIILVLGLAGALAKQPRVPTTAGTLPTHRPQFVGLLIVTTIVIAGLTFLPALALGPIAEATS